MNIIGYSERGAMNALFYGIAQKNDKGALEEFLKLAGITDKFVDFELFMEFSLSEYGDPDLVIIGKKPNGTKTVIFVEAKVSSCKTYDLAKEKNNHDNYIDNKINDKNHASNLFFQLRLKKYLKDGVVPGPDPYMRLAYSRGRNRKVGDNPIVQKMVSVIKKCTDAEYIAIVPKQTKKNLSKVYGMNIRYVTWEIICRYFSVYVMDTFVHNMSGNKSQILNN